MLEHLCIKEKFALKQFPPPIEFQVEAETLDPCL